jgi:hypothetical protein
MMASIGWRQWRVRAQIALWRHGWVWPLAIAAVGAVGLLQVAVLLPLREARASVELELARTLSAPPRPAATPESTTAERVAALRTMLQDAPAPTELLQQMSALAEAQQIQLPQGDYQQRVHPATGILQLQVSQPVRASYPRLRQYVESVLRAMPNVSLDQITAHRESIGQTELEVRLRWSLWLGPASAGAPTRPAVPAAPGAPTLARAE